MKKTWPIAILIIFVIALGITAIIYFTRQNPGTPAPSTEAAALEAAPEPGHVELKPEQVKAAGIQTSEVKVAKLAPEIRFFGQLQEDPSASFTLRAPASGTLLANPNSPFPTLGQSLPDNTTIATLIPRLAPGDKIALDTQRTTLQTQLAAAQADQTTATVSLASAQSTYDRLKALNAQDKNVSDRVVEEANAKLQTEQAHLDAASKTLDASRAALAALTAKVDPIPLVLEHGGGGQIVELLAQPGESVEPGQPILRVANFTHLLAALSIPATQTIPEKATTARILALAHEDQLLTATRITAAPIADPKTHGQTLLFQLTLDKPSLRPNTPITAYLPTDQPELDGVILPTAAIIHYLGQSWAYRQTEENEYQRTPINLDHPVEGGYFVTENLTAGDDVVTTGAQVLLNAEINAPAD